MARAQGARAQLLMAKESVYGTPPASGYRRMPFASTTLGQEQPLIDNELLGYGRDPQAPSRDAITADGQVVIPVDAQGIGHWLTGLLGAPVTTGASAPYTHTFQSGALTLPSYAIEKGTPEVPRYEMFAGCKVDWMEFKAERRGLLQATAMVVAQGMEPDTSSNGGTPTDLTLTRFGHFNGAVKRNGVAIGNIVSLTMRYSNNLDRIEVIRSDGKIDGADPSIAALTGQIVVRFADTVLHDQASAGDPCELELSWEIDAETSLTLTAHAVYLPQVRNPLDGPGGIQNTFDFQAAKAASPARMLTAVLVNDVASY
jgi:hypothetical protein